MLRIPIVALEKKKGQDKPQGVTTKFVEGGFERIVVDAARLIAGLGDFESCKMGIDTTDH